MSKANRGRVLVVKKSLASQYLREQVANDMAVFYTILRPTTKAPLRHAPTRQKRVAVQGRLRSAAEHA
jgi:hypothetical protein